MEEFFTQFWSILVTLIDPRNLSHPEQFRAAQPRGLTLGEIALLSGYAILMLGVCTLACVVPSVRALRVQPTEALRAE